ncbi:hypothetical protein [Cryobacterium sp. CAN_C2]|uniref:hypothetical protein n=1 Tax=Cryobacterium sp. CAN_C2 TaxID=2787723 RepID=UPI0018C93FF0
MNARGIVLLGASVIVLDLIIWSINPAIHGVTLFVLLLGLSAGVACVTIGLIRNRTR